MKKKNIGIDVKAPKEKCEDENCPFHGSLKIRTVSLVGTIVTSKMQKSATIEMPRKRYIPKYERFEKKRTKMTAHNPPCIKAKEGDVVRFMECRPISKTKNYVIVEILDKTHITSKEDMYEGIENKKTEEKVQEK